MRLMNCRLLLAFVAASFLMQPAISQATTGGAETIHQLLWDAPKQRVWYVRAVAGGYGRELGWFNTRTGRKKLVVAAADTDRDEDKKAAALNQLLRRGLARSKPLLVVSATRLGVLAQTEAWPPPVASGEVRDPGQYIDTLKGINLPWTVAIKSKKRMLGKTAVTACDFSKRGMVSGYGVPGRGFLVLLISTTGVCVEGGYRTDEVLFIRRAGVKPGHFLKAFASDYPPEKIVGASPGALLFPLPTRQLVRSLDALGSRALKTGRLKAAASCFHRAVYFQTGEPFTKGAHRLVDRGPLFRLAATRARLGQSEAALDHIQLLLSHGRTRSTFRDKVRSNAAFDALRNGARYKALLR